MKQNENSFGIIVTIRNASDPDHVFCREIIPIPLPFRDLLLRGKINCIMNFMNDAIHKIQNNINKFYKKVIVEVPSDIKFIGIDYQIIAPGVDVGDLVRVHTVPFKRIPDSSQFRFSARHKCLLMTDFYNFAKQQYLNNKQTTAMDISRDQEQLSNIVIEDSEEYSDSLADQVQVSGKDEHSGIYDDPADHVDQDLVKILSNDTSSEVPALNYQEGDQKVTEKLDKGDEIGSFSQIPSAFNKPFTKIDLTLFIREEIIEIAKKHAQEGIPYETGGALLGTVLMRDSSLLVVNTGLIKGKYMRQQEASLEFTPETWSYFWRSIDSDVSYKDDSIWKMVGWYHTHPSFGIFLSGMDRFIHNNFFAQPYHIALVLDPVKDTFGFFTWEGENGQVIEKPHHDITIYGESQIRELLSAESYEMPPVQIPVSSGLPE